MPVTQEEEAQARTAPRLLAASLLPDGQLRWLNVTLNLTHPHRDGVATIAVQGDLEILQGDAFRYTARIVAVTGALPTGDMAAIYRVLEDLAERNIVATVTCAPGQVTWSYAGNNRSAETSQSCLSHRPVVPIEPLLSSSQHTFLVLPIRLWPADLSFEGARREQGDFLATYSMNASVKTMHLEGPATAMLERGRIVQLQANLVADVQQAPATMDFQALFTYSPRVAFEAGGGRTS